MINKKQSLLFLFLLSFIISCAQSKQSNTATSEDDIAAEKEVVESAVYYVSGLSQEQTTKSTGAKTIYLWSVSGYLYQTWKWEGSGKSNVVKWGSATFSISYPYSFSFSISCSDNQIREVTLSSTGKVLNSEILDSGCGSVATELTVVSNQISIITNGFKQVTTTTSSNADLITTYTFQKSSVYNKDN
jgi:hypothetical protein